jgi:ribosomal protein L9
MREPIKTLGEHHIEVRVMPGVEATLTVEVVAQK